MNLSMRTKADVFQSNLRGSLDSLGVWPGKKYTLKYLRNTLYESKKYNTRRNKVVCGCFQIKFERRRQFRSLSRRAGVRGVSLAGKCAHCPSSCHPKYMYMQFVICTNTFFNLHKYSSQFGQIYSTIGTNTFSMCTAHPCAILNTFYIH